VLKRGISYPSFEGSKSEEYAKEQWNDKEFLLI
jgi:hypothetical protein